MPLTVNFEVKEPAWASAFNDLDEARHGLGAIHMVESKTRALSYRLNPDRRARFRMMNIVPNLTAARRSYSEIGEVPLRLQKQPTLVTVRNNVSEGVSKVLGQVVEERV